MKAETLTGAVSAAIAVWFFIAKWFGAASKIVEPLIKEAEKMAIDGKIDKAERKALVMKAVALLEQDGKIKLNFITRFILSRVVDAVAKRLPDFTISQQANDLLTKKT